VLSKYADGNYVLVLLINIVIVHYLLSFGPSNSVFTCKK